MDDRQSLACGCIRMINRALLISTHARPSGTRVVVLPVHVRATPLAGLRAH
jgi:hypothetical protein